MTIEKEKKYSKKNKKDLNKTVCFYCNKPGPLQVDCEKLVHEENKCSDNKDDTDNAMVAVLDEGSPEEDLAHTIWPITYAESSATVHMMKDKAKMSKGKGVINAGIETAGFRLVKVRGHGESNVKQSDEPKDREIELCTTVPRLFYNLVSVFGLDDAGDTLLFTNTGCVLKKNKIVLAIEELSGGMHV